MPATTTTAPGCTRADAHNTQRLVESLKLLARARVQLEAWQRRHADARPHTTWVAPGGTPTLVSDIESFLRG